jgi:hypothetical protein
MIEAFVCLQTVARPSCPERVSNVYTKELIQHALFMAVLAERLPRTTLPQLGVPVSRSGNALAR